MQTNKFEFAKRTIRHIHSCGTLHRYSAIRHGRIVLDWAQGTRKVIIIITKSILDRTNLYSPTSDPSDIDEFHITFFIPLKTYLETNSNKFKYLSRNWGMTDISYANYLLVRRFKLTTCVHNSLQSVQQNWINNEWIIQLQRIGYSIRIAHTHQFRRFTRDTLPPSATCVRNIFFHSIKCILKLIQLFEMHSQSIELWSAQPNAMHRISIATFFSITKP